MVKFQAKIRFSGGTYAITIPKAFVKNGIVKRQILYNVHLIEAEVSNAVGEP